MENFTFDFPFFPFSLLKSFSILHFMSIIIRTATFRDTRAIFNLIRDNSEELLSRSIADIVQNIDRFVVAVDPTDDEPLGAAAYDFLPEIGDIKRTSVEIKSVCVKDGWRGKNIGKMLVEAQIARLLPLEPYQFVVLTFAVGFFEKLGFEIVPKTTLMHKLYIGCINCVKHESPFTCPEQAMVRKVAK